MAVVVTPNPIPRRVVITRRVIIAADMPALGMVVARCMIAVVAVIVVAATVNRWRVVIAPGVVPAMVAIIGLVTPATVMVPVIPVPAVAAVSTMLALGVATAISCAIAAMLGNRDRGRQRKGDRCGGQKTCYGMSQRKSKGLEAFHRYASLFNGAERALKICGVLPAIRKD